MWHVLCRLHLWWHTATVLHLWTCWSLSLHNMSAIVSPSCMRSGECVSPPRHRFVCAHSGCFFLSSFAASQRGEFLYSDQASDHITFYKNPIKMWEIKWKLGCGLSSSLLKYFLLWLSDLKQIFPEILWICSTFFFKKLLLFLWWVTAIQSCFWLYLLASKVSLNIQLLSLSWFSMK